MYLLSQFIQAKRELNDPENAVIGAFAGSKDGNGYVPDGY
jgi:hypothetical protein